MLLGLEMPPSAECDQCPSHSVLMTSHYLSPGEGKERDLKENLDECLESSPDNAATALTNEYAAAQEEDKNEDGTTYHNLWVLGAAPIRRPKDEAAIQAQITELTSTKQARPSTSLSQVHYFI